MPTRTINKPYVKPASPVKAPPTRPARSNAGGVLRGKARVAAVKKMNAVKKSAPTHGAKTINTQKKNRGMAVSRAVRARAKAPDLFPQQRGSSAPAPAGSSGLSPLDFFGGAGLIRRDAEAIRRAVSR